MKSQGNYVILLKVKERLDDVILLITTRLKVTKYSVMDIWISHVNETTGYFKVRFWLDTEYIDVYERLKHGLIVKYAYSLIRRDMCLLRYDNAPHESHKNLPTFHHHRHAGNRVFPLYNPSLDLFLKECLLILRT